MNSQRFSPAPQFENISSLVLNLYSPALTSVPDYWRNIALTIWPLSAKWFLCFLIYCLGCHSSPSTEQTSFNFMTAVTICNGFEAQEKKICHCFHYHLPPPRRYLPWSDGTKCHNLCFFSIEFQASFHSSLSPSSGSSSVLSLSAIIMASTAYLSLLIFLPVILILSCDISSLPFCMMCSA